MLARETIVHLGLALDANFVHLLPPSARPAYWTVIQAAAHANLVLKDHIIELRRKHVDSTQRASHQSRCDLRGGSPASAEIDSGLSRYAVPDADKRLNELTIAPEFQHCLQKLLPRLLLARRRRVSQAAIDAALPLLELARFV